MSKPLLKRSLSSFECENFPLSNSLVLEDGFKQTDGVIFAFANIYRTKAGIYLSSLDGRICILYHINTLYYRYISYGLVFRFGRLGGFWSVSLGKRGVRVV